MLYVSEFMDFIFYAYYQDLWLKYLFDLDLQTDIKGMTFDFVAYVKNRDRFSRENKLMTKLTPEEQRHFLVNL